VRHPLTGVGPNGALGGRPAADALNRVFPDVGRPRWPNSGTARLCGCANPSADKTPATTAGVWADRLRGFARSFVPTRFYLSSVQPCARRLTSLHPGQIKKFV